MKLNKSVKLYKVLRGGGNSCHGGNCVWSLPDGDTPGKWMPKINDKLVVCKNGYHLITRNFLIDWINLGVYEAECKGKTLLSGDKIVTKKVRLLRRAFG